VSLSDSNLAGQDTALIHFFLFFFFKHILLFFFFQKSSLSFLENGLSSCSSSFSRPCSLPGLSKHEANSQATLPFAPITGCLIFKFAFSLFLQGDKVTGTSCPISSFTCACLNRQHLRI
jgi:hypothetical protein